MKKYVISGNNSLFGEVNIQGSKNSAVAILMASIATVGVTVLTNLPQIEDVKACTEILRYLGCDVIYESETTVRIDTRNAEYMPIPKILTEKMRASSYLIGALTARFGKCELPKSGGCDFGSRPIDLHLTALKSLGAVVQEDKITVSHGLRGGRISFPTKSVGATVNAIIAATSVNELTIIENAAREPHVKDLCSFLRKCGADITGAGNDTIRIRGRRKLGGCAHRIAPDMIEAGTYVCAALATGGKVRCANAPIGELTSFFSVLERMGAIIECSESCMCVNARYLYGTDAVTAPYPGFPTDLQPQICALSGLAEGESKITEAVFNNRLGHLSELKKFGLNCYVNGNVAQIVGCKRYSAASVIATDLRGGAAEVICALNADGISEISAAQLIERGYSLLPEKLRALGADITVYPSL